MEWRLTALLPLAPVSVAAMRVGAVAESAVVAPAMPTVTSHSTLPLLAVGYENRIILCDVETGMLFPFPWFPLSLPFLTVRLHAFTRTMPRWHAQHAFSSMCRLQSMHGSRAESECPLTAGESHGSVALGAAPIAITFLLETVGSSLVAVLADCVIVIVDARTGRTRQVGFAQPPKGRGTGRRLLLQARRSSAPHRCQHPACIPA